MPAANRVKNRVRKEEQDPNVYLSASEGRYRVIHQGVPISADKRTAEEALATAHHYKLKVSDRMWDGDRGEWTSIKAADNNRARGRYGFETQSEIEKTINDYIARGNSAEERRDRAPYESAEYWKQHDIAVKWWTKAESLMPGGSRWQVKRKLDPDQRAALLAYAAENGGRWKQNLRLDWEHARAQVDGETSAELQQIRNQFGPSWLNKTTLDQIRRGQA